MKFILFFSFLSLSVPVFAIPAEGHKMMIAAPSPRAVEVGQKVIQLGGNVVDVAVAVELALAVTSPYYASLGGGGFAMIRMKGQAPQAVDFRETAPILTHPNFYNDKGENASTLGALAVGIPGIPAGIWEIHQKYGKLKWSQLFTEPIRLAEQGFPVSGEWVRITEENRGNFNPSGLKYFFKNGTSYKPGEILKQPQLGKALRALRDQGAKAFYHGDLGKDLAQTLKKSRGVLAVQDLHNYKVRWLTPIQRNFLGHTVYMMPPPSSSGVLTSGLIGLAENLNLMKYTPMSTEEYHLIGEMLKAAFRGRTLLGDPDFNKNPIEHLTSAEYLKTLSDKISLKKPTTFAPLSDESLIKESTETTNFTVMDSDGNAVVMTITLNGSYGSAVVTDKYGIALNNEMDDFTTQPNKPNLYGLIQGKANYVQAGKRPLSSMSPTLILKDNKTVLGVGASGGPRILTAVFQVWYRVIAQKWDIDRAIQTPRVHHQFAPETLLIDERLFSADTKKNLEKMGHKTEASWMGRVNGVHLTERGILEGAHDARVEGYAAGL